MFHICFRYYTVSAPKVFRANSNYHISVTCHDADKASEVQVGIVGEQSGSSPYSNLKTITVEPDVTKLVEIDVSRFVFPVHWNQISINLSLTLGWTCNGRHLQCDCPWFVWLCLREQH